MIAVNDTENGSDQTVTSACAISVVTAAAVVDIVTDKDHDKRLDKELIQDAAANLVNDVLSVVSTSTPPAIDMLPTVSPSSSVVATVDQEDAIGVDQEGVAVETSSLGTDRDASIAATAAATVDVLPAVTPVVVSTTTADVVRNEADDDEEHAKILADIENHMLAAKLAHEHEQEAAQLLKAISFKVQAAKRDNEHEVEAAQLLEAIRYRTQLTCPIHTLY